MCIVTDDPAIWAGVAVTLTHLPASAVSALVTATSDFTSNETSERVRATGSEPLHVPPGGDWISTVRLTSLTVLLLDMSSSCRSTHFASVVPEASGVANGTHEMGAVLVAVCVRLALVPAAPSAP